MLNKYRIKLLEVEDDKALDVFCAACNVVGIENNKSRIAMKIDDPSTKFWVIYYLPTNEIISINGMQHFPLELESWGGLVENCYRLGLRQAILPDHRAKFSTGLGNKLEKNFNLTYVFPLQIEEALSHKAEKIIYTTNTPRNDYDSSGKLFQMDRVAHILAKNNWCVKVAENVKILYTYQNVWEINIAKWGF